MKKELAPVQKKDSLKVGLYYGAVFICCSLSLLMALWLAITAMLQGDIAFAAGGAILLLAALYTMTAPILSIGLTLYLNIALRNHDFAKLDAAHARALKFLSSLPVQKTWQMPLTLSNLATMRLCQGYFENAESLYRQAVNYVNQDSRMAKHYTAAVLINNLACACTKLHNYVEAELHATRALEILETVKKTDKMNSDTFKNFLTGSVYLTLGTIRYKLGELDDSLHYFEEAAKILETQQPALLIGSRAEWVCHAQMGLALVYSKRGQFDLSDQACQRVFRELANDSKALGPQSMEELVLVANEYLNQKKFDMAERLLDLAYSIGRNYSMHPDARQTLNFYEKLLLLTDRQSEVTDMRLWLRPSKQELVLQAPAN